MLERIKNTVSFIRSKTDFVPEVGIILGSGLGGLADSIDAACSLEYKDIPGFPVSTVEGHKGRLIFGMLGGRRVVAMQGRFHYYEGYGGGEVIFPVRVMKILGIDCLFVSNAAGGLNTDFRTGDVMVITDHINFIPNPLIGRNIDEIGTRFPDMSGAYDKLLVLRAREIAPELGVNLRYGCYVGVPGPSFETPAECTFFRMIGGDVVGMSTTPEVIAAAHCGLRVFALSAVTNMAISGGISTHEEVQREGIKAARTMTVLVTRMLETI